MSDRRLSESQARLLWERAARLHAEASARQLGSGDAPDESSEAETRSEGDYTVDVVVRSAVEAGIPQEYVDQALSEIGSDGDSASGLVDRWADSYIGDARRQVQVRRVVDAPVGELYEAMQRVFPNAPFGLTLAGIDGKPLEGGRMTFDVPYNLSSLGGSSSHKIITDLRHWADIKEISFRIRAVPGDGARSEIEVTAPLAHSRRVNFWTGNAMGGVLGVLGGLVSGAIASGLLGPAVLATFGIAGVGALGTFAGVRQGWRPLYRMVIGKAESALDRLISALVVDMQTGGAFTARIEPKSGSADAGVKGMLDQLGL